jgi:hypothetical protein
MTEDGQERSDSARHIQTSQETHSGLKEEIQDQGEHDGKDDRACNVERRQGTQREQATEKERPRRTFFCSVYDTEIGPVRRNRPRGGQVES